MNIIKCDICGGEVKNYEELIFTQIKRRYMVFTSLKEEHLDVCSKCQNALAKILKDKGREEE